MFFKYNAITVIWFVIMSVLLFLPGSSLPNANQWNFFMLDKLVHTGLFAVFSLLMVRGFAKQEQFSALNNRSYTYAAILGFSYAILAEILQQTASERNFEWQDIAANLLGCLMGLIIFKILNKN